MQKPMVHIEFVRPAVAQSAGIVHDGGKNPPLAQMDVPAGRPAPATNEASNAEHWSGEGHGGKPPTAPSERPPSKIPASISPAASNWNPESPNPASPNRDVIGLQAPLGTPFVQACRPVPPSPRVHCAPRGVQVLVEPEPRPASNPLTVPESGVGCWVPPPLSSSAPQPTASAPKAAPPTNIHRFHFELSIFGLLTRAARGQTAVHGRIKTRGVAAQRSTKDNGGTVATRVLHQH